MIKFLVIEQDLRVSGTSQGIISRSFLAKLRMTYPNAIIDVLYLKHHESEDCLDLLPIDSIVTHVLNLKIPFFTKWYNKLYWRLFHVSLNEDYVHKVYASYIAKVSYEEYDHIFIRSAGLNCEMLLAAKNLPILKKSIITFNEPYPMFWCSGAKLKLDNLDLFRLKNMNEVVGQSKSCMATSFLAKDMQYLYGSQKIFYEIPHQFDETVFDLNDKSQVFQKSKKVAISYHGALQFGRNIEVLLDCYSELINSNKTYKENTEFFMRLKSSELNRLKEKYFNEENIIFLEGVNFSNSMYEQKHLSDIDILLENGPIYCSILLGKAPLVASFNKPILVLSPHRSEIKAIIKDEAFVANYDNKEEIKTKLENLIINRLNDELYINPFGDYFSDENFKLMLDKIIKGKDD